MKIAVIDIGSNSVRLMMWADGKTLYKTLNTTRLGEGLSASPYLKAEAIERTVSALSDFKKRALAEGAKEVYAFATAAVRFAKNGGEFVNAAYNNCGIKVDVLSGEEEAAMGLAGALNNEDGGIIDVGGASTEVTVRKSGKVVYTKSVNVGTVRILDSAGRDLEKIKEFIAPKVAEFEGGFPDVQFYGIGGTASRLGAIAQGITEYDASVISGTRLSAEYVHGLSKKLTDMSVEEVRATTICKKAADLIGGGACLMASVMDRLGVESLTVSESDNLEGYIILRGIGK